MQVPFADGNWELSKSPKITQSCLAKNNNNYYYYILIFQTQDQTFPSQCKQLENPLMDNHKVFQKPPDMKHGNS